MGVFQPVLYQRLFLIACLLALLSACSLAGFAYDLAPRLAVRHADGYLHLNGRQSARALELFRERHALHARDELPRYYRFLVDVRNMGDENGLSRQEIDEALDRVRFLYHLAVERTLPAIAEILHAAEPAQIDYLEKRLLKDTGKDRKRVRRENSEDRAEKTLDDIREWVGRLDDSQQEQIRQAMSDMHDTRGEWLDWRSGNIRRFVEFLRTGPSQVQIENRLAAYWIKHEGMPETLETRLQENVERFRSMLVDLDRSLTEEQREHARKRLDKFADMVAGIMPDDVRVVAPGGGLDERKQAGQ